MNITATHNDIPNPASAKRAELHDAAEQLVSEAFLNTLMRMHRENPLKGKYGHGGRGEEIFGAQLDAILSQKASTALKTTLTDAVIRQLSRGDASVTPQLEVRA